MIGYKWSGYVSCAESAKKSYACLPTLITLLNISLMALTLIRVNFLLPSQIQYSSSPFLTTGYGNVALAMFCEILNDCKYGTNSFCRG